jgi:hypothetical protein
MNDHVKDYPFFVFTSIEYYFASIKEKNTVEDVKINHLTIFIVKVKGDPKEVKRK